MADVKGGRGVTGMSFSGKGNLEKGKAGREMGFAAGKGDREKPSSSYPRIGFNAITPPGTSSRMLSQKFSTKYAPGDYAAYRKALAAKMVAKKPVAKPVVKPAAVVSNVVREKLSPTKAAPARMAVNPRTGNTTGFTTGKTTGTSVSKSGVATKTYQSAGDRMKANAMNRTNQPAGPMGGGGGSRGGSLGGGGASRTSSGGGNLGGARGRISEPGGSKR